ncbi:MAG: DUF5683 domain-containing protein [Paludibacteraceae bacterium]
MKKRWLLALMMVGLSCTLSAQQAGNDSVQNIDGRLQTFDFQKNSTNVKFATDTTATVVKRRTTDAAPRAVWLPDPQKSLWYAFIFPGAGQIYNRSYWKLPIVYGGAVGLVYGISWNNRYYKEYTQAYRDIMDNDPNTKSYENLLPYGTDPNSTYAQNLMKNKHNTYRRYRDLCIVGAVAFYALTIIDAYVDAQLADFDISPDLSMRVRPTLLLTENTQKPSFGVGIGFNF